jgi:hypothetical protein
MKSTQPQMFKAEKHLDAGKFCFRNAGLTWGCTLSWFLLVDLLVSEE